jgi:glucose-1-phosphate thymidylyltransferase
LGHVANQPIAHHVLDVLKCAGVQDVIVASSAEHSSAVRKCCEKSAQGGGIRLTYVAQPGPLDLAGAFRLAAPKVGSAPCIVHVASGLLDEPLNPFLKSGESQAPDVVVFAHQRPAPDGHLSAATQDMLHLAELDPQVAGLGIAGVWLFGRHALQRVAGADWNGDGEVDLTRIVESITAAGGNLRMVRARAWCRYAGDPRDLLELNRTALERLQSDLQLPRNNGNRIEGRVQIDERASVRASVIVGPTVIGPGARISDAYIGPYTSIGPGARVEGVEIEGSIVSAGASIMHVGGRMVASVVGENARVFRDFSLPRGLRLRVGQGNEVALC